MQRSSLTVSEEFVHVHVLYWVIQSCLIVDLPSGVPLALHTHELHLSCIS